MVFDGYSKERYKEKLQSPERGLNNPLTKTNGNKMDFQDPWLHKGA